MSDLRRSVLNSQQLNRWSEINQSQASTSGSRSSGPSIRFISVPGMPPLEQSNKIERKLREFLSNFKNGDVRVSDGVKRILRIFEKYGPNHADATSQPPSQSSSSSAKPQPLAKPKTKPKPKSNGKKLSLEKELARLADSAGFVSTPPRKSKRQRKPVVLFDETQYETKRKLRSSRSRGCDDGIMRKSISKKVSRTSVIKMSPKNANVTENVRNSLKTSSTLVSNIERNADGSLERTIKHTITHQRTATFSTNNPNFKYKNRMIYHIPMVLVKQEGESGNRPIDWF